MVAVAIAPVAAAPGGNGKGLARGLAKVEVCAVTTDEVETDPPTVVLRTRTVPAHVAVKWIERGKATEGACTEPTAAAQVVREAVDASERTQ